MAFKAPWLPRCLLFLGFFITVNSWGLNLGNIEVLSQGAQALQAKIAIVGNDKELRQLSGLKVQFPAPEVYSQYGLPLPSNESNPFTLSIEKTSDQVPQAILISATSAIPEDTLFNDIVLEISWNGGKLVRIYTILNTRKSTILVSQGDNLTKITQSLLPELPQASFEQALIAIFRLNPKAFIAGNIHRLKAGAELIIPTATMMQSIPKEEAKQFTLNAEDDFQKKLFSKSSEIIYSPTSSPSFDRLLLSSSEGISEKKILETKLEEELIAQKKILEQAQSRIAEIQKNIAMLNQQSGNEATQANTLVAKLENHAVFLREWILFLALLTIFIYGNFIRKNAPIGIHEATAHDSTREMPEFARNIFATLDLNIESNSQQNLSTAPFIGESSDKKVLPSSQNTLKENKPSVTDQKLRLNLAKSYIQINDFPTAKIILQEIVQLGGDGQDEIVREAQQYLLQIA